MASVGAEMAFLAGFCLPREAKWRSGPHVDAAACHRMQTSPPAGMQSPFQLAGAHPDGMQMRPGCHPAGCKCIPMSIHANGCIFCIPRKAKHHATRTQPAAPGRNADVIPRIAGKLKTQAAPHRMTTCHTWEAGLVSRLEEKNRQPVMCAGDGSAGG